MKNIIKNKKLPEKEKEAEWEIEAIVGQEKGPDGKILYHIKWLNYPDSQNTWQFYSNIKDTDVYSNWLFSKKKK